jgi:hypothetical protein
VTHHWESLQKREGEGRASTLRKHSFWQKDGDWGERRFTKIPPLNRKTKSGNFTWGWESGRFLFSAQKDEQRTGGHLPLRFLPAKGIGELEK